MKTVAQHRPPSRTLNCDNLAGINNAGKAEVIKPVAAKQLLLGTVEIECAPSLLWKNADGAVT